VAEATAILAGSGAADSTMGCSAGEGDVATTGVTFVGSGISVSLGADAIIGGNGAVTEVT
jgi:hypothetical protein